MRILLLGINYAPELTGIGKYSGEMAKWLAEEGHAVRVITAPPYYPEWHVGPGYKAWKYYRETIDGVTVWRCPLWIPSKLSGFKRLIHLASFAVSCLPIMIGQILWRPHVVMVVEPPLFCAPIALLVARLTGAKSWLHVQDFEVDAAFELGILRSARLRQFVLFLERFLMQMFDRISTISGAMRDRLRSKFVSEEKIVNFPNWVDLSKVFPAREASPEFRRELGIPPSKVVVLYSGNLGEKQGLDVLIEAARLLANDPGIHFVIAGEGGTKSRLQQHSQGLTNIQFMPLQPLERLNLLLNSADIHVLPQRAGAADLVMPSKLTGMLACGGAVIATAASGTEVARVVQQAGGVVCPPGDAHILAQEIRTLATDGSKREAMAITATQFATNHLAQDPILREMERRMTELVGLS